MIAGTFDRDGAPLRPYPSYRDSSAEWLERMPSHWDTRPLKYFARFINGAPFKPSDWGDSGTPIIRIENLNKGRDFNYTTVEADERYHVRDGDLLFAWSGNRGTSFGPFIWYQPGLHYLNQHIFRLAEYSVNKKWFYWTLRAVTAYVEEKAHGIIGLVHITKRALGVIRLPVVPTVEQQRIAAFLDRESAKIDAMVAKKERLIELLEERHHAIMAKAVTQGINPSARKAETNCPWLGKVPSHWEVGRFKYRYEKIEQGWSPQCDNRLTDPGEWGVLKVGCMNSGVYEESENKALPPSLAPRPEYEIKEGDLLMSRSNTVELVGSVGRVHETQGRIMLCDKLYRIVIDESRLLGNYAVCLLRSHPARQQIERDASGASPSMKNISNARVGNLVLAYPSIEEQAKILSHLEARSAEINALVSNNRDLISTLLEFRTALISAAVTGEIDVREAV